MPRPPTYRVEARCHGCVLTPAPWRVREDGKPTLNNLERWLRKVPKRFGPVVEAKIIRQLNGEVVVCWTGLKMAHEPASS